MGIRTVRDDAGPISFHHAFVRHLIGVVEIWVFSGVPALVCALVSTKGKRIGDFAAGTYVVRDRFRLQLPWPVQMPPAPRPLGRRRRHRSAARLPGRRAAPAAGPDRDAEPRGEAHPGHPHRGRGPAVRLAAAAARHPPRGFLAAVAAERRRRDEHRLWREADLRWRLTHNLSVQKQQTQRASY